MQSSSLRAKALGAGADVQRLPHIIKPGSSAPLLARRCSLLPSQPRSRSGVQASAFVRQPADAWGNPEKVVVSGESTSAPTVLSPSLSRKPQLVSAAGSTSSSSSRRLAPATSAVSQRQKVLPVTKKSSGSSRGGRPDGEEPEGWGFFDAERYNYRWDVPWGWKRTVGGMTLWFGSFIAVAALVIPASYIWLAGRGEPVSEQDRTFLTLLAQSLETIVGLSVIRVVTVGPLTAQQEGEDGSSSTTQSQATGSSFWRRAPKQKPAVTKQQKKSDEPQGPPGPDALFNYSPAGAFTAPYGWAVWGLIGALLSPFVVGIVANIATGTGYDITVGGKGTVDGVAGMIEVDWSSYISLLIVTGVLAPILEETVFRGFLLPSLTKYMPTWAAVGLSSLAFGAAHFSPRDFPVLSALGALLGVSYVRSRNLLTPILIHGIWNSVVLSALFALAASGLDVQELIKEIR